MKKEYTVAEVLPHTGRTVRYFDEHGCISDREHAQRMTHEEARETFMFRSKKDSRARFAVRLIGER